LLRDGIEPLAIIRKNESVAPAKFKPVDWPAIEDM
jgi:hypothetical protein